MNIIKSALAALALSFAIITPSFAQETPADQCVSPSTVAATIYTQSGQPKDLKVDLIENPTVVTNLQALIEKAVGTPFPTGKQDAFLVFSAPSKSLTRSIVVSFKKNEAGEYCAQFTNGVDSKVITEANGS